MTAGSGGGVDAEEGTGDVTACTAVLMSMDADELEVAELLCTGCADAESCGSHLS